MTTLSYSKNLIVLTADPQMERAIATLLEHRKAALQIADISVDVVRHRNKDPGCRTDAASVLNPRRNVYQKAMILFDFHGCGERNRSASQLENHLEQEFTRQGWGNDRIAFIVIAPELEAWIFGASFEQIRRAVGWSQSEPLRDWLVRNRHLPSGSLKPPDPKAAIEAILRRQKKPRSAKLYADLARNVSVAHCQDRAFQKFRSTLQRWFPV